MENAIEHALAQHVAVDALTGLANRATLEVRVAQSLADSRRHHRKAALMFIAVNASLGDHVLAEAARRLVAAVRETDTVARLGGDEFAVFIKDVGAVGDVGTVAAKILHRLREPLQLDGSAIRPSASIGIALFPDDGGDLGALLANAGVAMQHAKSLGGARFRFSTAETNTRMAARFAMEADLRRALERDELLLHYQPQVSLATGAVTGAEALVRWNHPEKGVLAPAAFIPLAEETGLILPLGEWVIAHACVQMRAWLFAGLTLPSIAVNLCARQFLDPGLVPMIQRALRANRLDPRLLEIELTEAAVMQDVESALATVHELKQLGVRISLDDFGSGYSSLAHLKRLPLDHLKIDRSFVKNITSDSDDAAICHAAIGLAHGLNLTVIAEGVETEQQMSHLRRHRCDEMQGYLFSHPLPGTEFADLLRQRRCLPLPPQERQT